MLKDILVWIKDAIVDGLEAFIGIAIIILFIIASAGILFGGVLLGPLVYHFIPNLALGIISEIVGILITLCYGKFLNEWF